MSLIPSIFFGNRRGTHLRSLLSRLPLPSTFSGKFGIREHPPGLKGNTGSSYVQGRSSWSEGGSDGRDRGRR
ncbi:hypothetical protein CsSME_00025385 [Camellia sinensis var. sinensis]